MWRDTQTSTLPWRDPPKAATVAQSSGSSDCRASAQGSPQRPAWAWRPPRCPGAAASRTAPVQLSLHGGLRSLLLRGDHEMDGDADAVGRQSWRQPQHPGGDGADAIRLAVVGKGDAKGPPRALGQKIVAATVPARCCRLSRWASAGSGGAAAVTASAARTTPGAGWRAGSGSAAPRQAMAGSARGIRRESSPSHRWWPRQAVLRVIRSWLQTSQSPASIAVLRLYASRLPLPQKGPVVEVGYDDAHQG